MEIELLQTAGEQWSFYLEPILFHKLMALVDSPRLLVWYESSVCLWVTEEFPVISCCSDTKERNALSLVLSPHSRIHDGLEVCVCMCVRKSAVVAVALYLMHNSDTVHAHITWTISTSKTAVCIVLYHLSFCSVSFHMLFALWVLVWCHSSHAKLIAKACIDACCNEVITV